MCKAAYKTIKTVGKCLRSKILRKKESLSVDLQTECCSVLYRSEGTQTDMNST